MIKRNYKKNNKIKEVKEKTIQIYKYIFEITLFLLFFLVRSFCSTLFIYLF